MNKNKFITFASFLIIALTIIIVFGKVTKLGYTWLDDINIIGPESQFIKDIKNIPSAFLQDAFISSGKPSYFYRPFLVTSFILDAQYCHQNISCFHLINLVIHIFFSFLFFIFLQMMGVIKRFALLLTIIFALHPTIISAVAWIPGRNDSLLGLFFLSSFIFYMLWQQYKNKYFLLIHTLLFNFALYTKETAVMLPILIILYHFFVRRKSLFKKSFIYFYPFWIISYLIWGGLRAYAIRNATYLVLKNLSTENFPGILLYIGKIIPVKLSVLPILKDSTLIPGIIITIIFFAILFFFKKKYRDILYGYSWYLLLIIPTVIQFKNTTNFLLEHRNYLPFAGLFIVLGKILPTKIKCHKVVSILMIFIIVFFSYITYKRIDYYHNSFTFFTQATKESPHSAEAFQALGYVYQSDNNIKMAISLYNKSLELNPNVLNAHTNLGLIYLNEGDFIKAENEIKKEQVGGNEYTWLHLGRAYYGQGKKKEAQFAWEQAYKLDPNYLPAVINLALVNSDSGNYVDAKKYYLKAVALGGYQSIDKKWLEKIKFLENK